MGLGFRVSGLGFKGSLRCSKARGSPVPIVTSTLLAHVSNAVTMRHTASRAVSPSDSRASATLQHAQLTLLDEVWQYQLLV